MAKKKGGKVLNFVAWITGVIVSLSVGFSMASTEAGTLSLPLWLGGSVVAQIAGWIVIITTLIGIISAILEY
ncbi:MAG: hypothetical protein WDZ62_02495 [Candidatus Pacearchaeota archaeon]